MNQQALHIDWANVRARLQEGDKALQEADSVAASRMQSVFRERAIQLAGVSREGVAEGCPMLIFSLGEQRYAVELRLVAEVVHLPRCTPVPGGPPALLGVINHRGEAKSVMDLGWILNQLPSSSPTEGFFLLLHEADRQLRVRVDAADEVRRMDLEKLASPPAFSAGPAARFVKGVHPDGTIVLSVEAILDNAASSEAA